MAEPTRQPKQTIRQLRQARGWRQVDLAAHLGVTDTAVANWEGGRRWPSPTHRQRLADLFGVNVEAIAFGPAAPGHERSQHDQE